MADDLATLHGAFGGFQDEEEVRMEVAARVVAQSSRAALEDEELVKKSWRALEKAEGAVRELQQDLEEAQLAVAQQSSGLAGDAGTTAPPRRVSDIRFQLNAAERELKRADAAVRQVQRDVDRRQAARLAEAQRREREEAEAERATAAAAAAARTAATSSAGTASSSNSKGSAAAVPQQSRTGRPMPLASSSGPFRRPITSATPPTSAVPGANGHPAATDAAAVAAARDGTTAAPHPASSPTTSRATRVVYRVPSHLRGITASEYSGGAVLPSLNRVQVTRADIHSKQRRYQDDSELEHYVERIAKRQRLEAVANQQRRVVAAAAATAGGAGEGRRTPQSSQTPQSAGSQRTGAAATKAAASVKEERRDTGDGAKRRVKVEEADLMPLPAAPKPSFDDFTGGDSKADVAHEDEEEMDVIDVDALMEDDDDAAVAAAVTRATTQFAAGTSTPSLSQSSQQAQQQQQQQSLTSDRASSVGSESGDLVLEMEEVTLLPGVRMDAAIYNRLLDYQQEGLLWLLALHARRSGGILGDEMGLGKTIQIAAMLNALHHSCLLRGPALIVAPMTVLRQWLAELHRWAPYMRSCVMHESSGSDATRESLLRSVQGTPAIVITTYSAMRVHGTLLQRTGFQYVILDEGHKISNPDAGITLAAKAFTTPHRLILSGSPIQNSLKELWCLFDFVRPGLLGTMNRFVEEFEAPIAQSRNVRASPLALATAVECAKTLQAHIAPFLLRRLKRQVITSLPPKYERVLRVPLSDEQVEQYLQVLSSPVVQRLFAQTVMYGSRTGGLDRDGRDSTGSLHVAGARLNMAQRRYNSGLRLESFRLMNQLRQICNHADIYAVQRGADEEDRMLLGGRRAGQRAGAAAAPSSLSRPRPGQHRSFRSNNPVNLDGSGKLKALLMMLREWRGFGHRVLVFSQTRMMLDIIENLCEQESYTYIRMDGCTNGHHRQELMDRFNEDDSIFVALLTTRVGGIGVNLIGADRVVIFDPDWNPITDVQARERAWRIGQKREVCVYRLITSGSVEESILRRQLAKMYVTDKVLKDPELQRFFHVQDTFMESFLLGAEYASRVPVDKRYLLGAHQLSSAPPSHRSAAAAASAGVVEYGNAVPGVDEEEADSDSSTIGSSDDDAEERAEGAVRPRQRRQPKTEREFGLLVPIKNEGDVDADDAGVVADDGDGDADGVDALGVPSPRKPAAKKEWSETKMLQNLVDRQGVAVAGHDHVAHRLARKKAEDMLRRVSSSSLASAADEMRAQQRQFSLLHALKEKAKEAAEREEQGRFYREATAASAKRRRNL